MSCSALHFVSNRSIPHPYENKKQPHQCSALLNGSPIFNLELFSLLSAIVTAGVMILPYFDKVYYTPLTNEAQYRRRSFVPLIRCACVVVVAVLLSLIAWLVFRPCKDCLGFTWRPDAALSEVPRAFETVAVVFYGRRSRVEILDCYLKVHCHPQTH